VVELRPFRVLASLLRFDILLLRDSTLGEVCVEEGGEYVCVAERELKDFFDFKDAGLCETSSGIGGGVSNAREERGCVCRVLLRVECR